jgi:predicted alpha/beta superfamily hydrolase
MLDAHELPSLHLNTIRRLTVWMPPRVRTRRAGPYPVLYLNDGQNLFDPARAFAGNTWHVADTVTRLVRARRIPPLMIVGIDHGGVRRNREYLPVEDARNPTAQNPLGREYTEFVTREVMPFIARHYPVARGASNTGFGGSSYGAIAALSTVMTRPGIFGKLLIESPSLYVGGEYLLGKAVDVTRWPARIYLGVGTNETRSAERNQETVDNVLKLGSILRAARLGPRRLRTVVEEGATHSEGAWAGRLPQALEFLFGR